MCPNLRILVDDTQTEALFWCHQQATRKKKLSLVSPAGTVSANTAVAVLTLFLNFFFLAELNSAVLTLWFPRGVGRSGDFPVIVHVQVNSMAVWFCDKNCRQIEVPRVRRRPGGCSICRVLRRVGHRLGAPRCCSVLTQKECASALTVNKQVTWLRNGG